ncbi:hypothetical protein Adi01nite_73280 [Amorphoplanes digitatis]|nr:hypothetical protein Adi01nite_73280 [Actinoplanes digitatis]
MPDIAMRIGEHESRVHYRVPIGAIRSALPRRSGNGSGTPAPASRGRARGAPVTASRHSEGALIGMVVGHGDQLPESGRYEPLAGKQVRRPRNPGAAQMKMSVRRSPLGERLNAAPAERYSAKAKGEARGH